MKQRVWSTNTRGLKGHWVDFIGVQNAHIFRMLPPLCVRGSLAWMEGGSDLIAEGKRVDAGGMPDQTFSTGEWEKGDLVRSLVFFWQQTSRLQN